MWAEDTLRNTGVLQTKREKINGLDLIDTGVTASGEGKIVHSIHTEESRAKVGGRPVLHDIKGYSPRKTVKILPQKKGHMAYDCGLGLLSRKGKGAPQS